MTINSDENSEYPDLVLSEMTWGIGWTVIRTFKSLTNFTLIDLHVLSKTYNFSARKFQRNCVSWHWRVMQNSEENWLVACKMT